MLVLAGGSNLVVADDGFPGTVLASRPRSDPDSEDPTTRTAWARSPCRRGRQEMGRAGRPGRRRGLGRLEALSGIPGLVGATPIQNVGAYGQEVAETIASVRTRDREHGRLRTFAAAECGFGYRTSRFKEEPGRFVVLDVTFLLKQGSLGSPVRYAELAGPLGVEPGERAPLADVRAAVLKLRSGKGMVLDPEDHDTWSAGSFFTNPVVAAGGPRGCPRMAAADGGVKTSAAWLIERAGFGKGYGGDRLSLSTKHTLALTNRGGATTADLLALAREIRDGVEARFGIRLVNEPVLVGCTL